MRGKRRDDWKDGETPRRAGAVIVCTGGVSYPSTGSTGDGYELLESLRGIPSCRPNPRCAGCSAGRAWIHGSLQGLSLKNVRLTLTHGTGKRCFQRDRGNAVHAPGRLRPARAHGLKPHGGARRTARLTLDLKPGLREEQLDAAHPARDRGGGQESR